MNYKNLFSIITFTILTTLVASSCASKRYTKKAVKFEEAGLYEDAANYYYEAVKKKASNVEAKLGLRKTGQIAMDGKLAKVKNSYKQTDYEDVVYHYMDASSYSKKIKSVGVELMFPKIYESYYDEAKTDYLSRLYLEGIDKLNREEFEEALNIFQEIINVEPGYKDVNDSYIIAKYEPIYRNANTYLENELYRKAFYTYSEILRGTGEYKQALSLKNKAREEGTITILVINFDVSNQSYKPTANVLTSELKSEMINLNNPFIKVVDDESVHRQVYENGQLNLVTANLIGINAILNGKVLKIKKQNGKLSKETKRGYIKEVKKIKNREGQETTITDYKKTVYTQYHCENIAELQVEFSLISTVNSEILASAHYKLSKNDEINYARFNGNKNNLVPGYWKSKSYKSEDDIIKDNWSSLAALRGLLKADDNLKPVSSLLNELVGESSSKIVKKVDDYNPE